jgi:hypothetical protein
MNMDERRVTYKRRGTRRVDKNIADKLVQGKWEMRGKRRGDLISEF